MSELEFNAIFSKRLRYYLNQYDMTQTELAKRLGVSTQSVTNWCKGDKSPLMDKVDSMCEIFHCKRSDLMEDNELSTRDKRDIKKDLDNIMEKLTHKEYGPAAYDGEDLTEESIDLFRDELEIALKRLKLINKEKYNPNKNKK